MMSEKAKLEISIGIVIGKELLNNTEIEIESTAIKNHSKNF